MFSYSYCYSNTTQPQSAWCLRGRRRTKWVRSTDATQASSQYTLPSHCGKYRVHDCRGSQRKEEHCSATHEWQLLSTYRFPIGFAEVIEVLVVETNQYCHHYLDILDEPFLASDVTEYEIFLFLSITSKMWYCIWNQLTDYWTTMNCPQISCRANTKI
jgi:hypothetical protein